MASSSYYHQHFPCSKVLVYHNGVPVLPCSKSSTAKAFWKFEPTSIVRGSYFEKDWNERCEEVYFPRRHVAHLPWMELYLERIPLHPALRQLQHCRVVVKSLSHVTHEKEFFQICSSDPTAYILRPGKKTGKSGYGKYNGAPVGHTFVACDHISLPNGESEYRHIKPHESIFPGNYVWWSVEINELHVPDYPHPYYVGPYKVSHPFSDYAESPYGNMEIYGYIKHVLAAYQSSFPHDPSNGKLPRIELRNGGTLRYKFEVCHVIIVCAAYIRKRSPLSLDQYPLWDEGRNKIKYNAFTGAITWVDPLTITFKNGIKCSQGQIHSWDNFVFAFHFPDEQQFMKCPKETFNYDEVDHDDYICLKKRPCLYKGGGCFCPNEC